MQEVETRGTNTLPFHEMNESIIECLMNKNHTPCKYCFTLNTDF